MALGLLAALAGAASCRDVSGPDHTVDLGYDFTVSNQGWDTGFADYPVGQDAAMQLVADRRPLPASLDTTGEALYLAGLNTSDDLFMYLKRRIPDLRASRVYTLTYRIEIASDAGTECVGVGGSPGEGVYVKAGAVPYEPTATVEDEAGREVWRMNVDKGQQSQGGENAEVIGDIANGETQCTDTPYRRKVIEGSGITVRSSSDGVIWLLVGTDSGFEGHTGIYYLSMEVVLEG